MPKFPVISYKLLETTNKIRWSKEEFDSPVGHTLLTRSPIKDMWTSGLVETSVPQECLIIKDKIITTCSRPGWATINNFRFDDVNNKVIATVAHQYYDSDTDFTIQCKYRKSEKYTEDAVAYLEYMGKKVTDGLSYGTYIYKLPADFGFYTLELSFFNGEIVTSTNYDVPKNGVEAKIKPVGEGFKNLVITTTP